MLNSSTMTGFIAKRLSQIIEGMNLGRSPSDDGLMELYILNNKLQVCSCPREKIDTVCHSIIKIALLPDSRPNFFSLTETNGQYTLILTEDDFQDLPENSELETSGQPWRVLTVSVGALGSCNEIMGISKIARYSIGPLADHQISVLCLSTYQSDYILVQESQLKEAIKCLSFYFKIFNEDHQQVIESKPTSPASPLPRKSRPIIHPYKSPNKIFHVAGLDASKLAGVIQILLELIFFPKKKSNDDDSFSFFHYTVVHGDISLVLDDKSFNKFPKNTLYTSHSTKDGKWKIISIGNQPLGFVECGIVAQVVEPLAMSQVSSYYLSTYNIEYCMICENDYEKVKEMFDNLKLKNLTKDSSPILYDEEPNQEQKTGDETPEVSDTEDVEDMRPGENLCFSNTLDTINDHDTMLPNHLGDTFDTINDHDTTLPYHLSEHGYSRSPLTPTSECSSYGTSPQSDDCDMSPTTAITTSNNTTETLSNTPGTTVPIPIPSLRDSLTRLRC